MNQKSNQTKVDDPLDRKGLFFVVDWDKRTLGHRHDKLGSAVKEFDKSVADGGNNYHFSVVELLYPSGENGLPLYAQLKRVIK